MDITGFGSNLSAPVGGASEQPAAETSALDAVWLVLEAANDLGDDAAVAACRRVIDAALNGRLAAQADLNLVQDYFK
jgi:hypothetical protein